MNRLLRAFAIALGLLSFGASFGGAATPSAHTEDLGQDLAYLRPDIRTDDAILLKAVAAKAVVLDLRYVSSGENAAGWLAAIKEFTATGRVCLVLVSPETASALIGGLSVPPPGCITVGRASPALGAIIPVDTPADADRRAWEAIGKGVPLAKLITENVDKPRYDEAVLAKEHAAGLDGEAAPAEDPDLPPAPAKTGDPKTPPSPAPLIDAVLERAVQIQRGLLALKKL
ncbi:MAG: hypothetical protein JF599_09165 [Verrucomicrobia bacterium]|nr:hypothetical protein [Verrucomicrobiota bacterium]